MVTREGYRITTWLDEWCTREVYGFPMGGKIYHLDGSKVLVTMVGTIQPGLRLPERGVELPPGWKKDVPGRCTVTP